MSTVLAVDVGGTTTAGGIVTDSGDVLVERQLATHGDGPGTVRRTIEAVSR